MDNFIDSAFIKDFRCFDEVGIKFRQVNLIIGKNSRGKTTLLELLHSYAAEHSAVKDFITPNFSGVYKFPIKTSFISDTNLCGYEISHGDSKIISIHKAITSSDNGWVLIDEIENGFHYSKLEDVFRSIFSLSYKLNYQLFATTHSLDAIKAFQKISERYSNEFSCLIRLRDKNSGGITSDSFERDTLKMMMNSHVELR